MEPWVLAVITAAVLIAVLLIAAVVRSRRRRRSQELRDTFGPEYERAVHDGGHRARAERELLARRRRVGRLDIRPIEPDLIERLRANWAAVELDFVDEPGEAVRNAHRLLLLVMRERGYPTEDFEQRAADLSVHHPTIVDDYRAANDIAARHSEGGADTEDLRQAVIHYRVLFEELLGVDREPKGAR